MFPIKDIRINVKLEADFLKILDRYMIANWLVQSKIAPSIKYLDYRITGSEIFMHSTKLLNVETLVLISARKPPLKTDISEDIVTSLIDTIRDSLVNLDLNGVECDNIQSHHLNIRTLTADDISVNSAFIIMKKSINSLEKMCFTHVHWKEKKSFNFLSQTKFNLVLEATVYDCDEDLVKYFSEVRKGKYEKWIKYTKFVKERQFFRQL